MLENEILKLILQNAQIAYWDWNVIHNKATLSSNFHTLFGYSQEELIPNGEGLQHLTTIIVTEDLAKYQNLFEEGNYSSKGDPFKAELRYYHKNGSIIWTNFSAQVIEWDENGNPLRVIGSHENITLLKEQEEAASKVHDVYKVILNEIPQSVFWRDSNNVYLGCNNSFAKTLGLQSPDAIIGKTNYDFPSIEKEDIKFYHDEDKEILTNAKSRLHFVGQIYNTEGTSIWVDSSKIPLKSNNGTPYAVLGIFSNITEHEKIKLELTRINKLYNTLRRINEIMHDISSKEVLYDKVCSILTDVGGFQLASIAEPVNNQLTFLACAGHPTSYINNLSLKFDNVTDSIGPEGNCIKNKQKYVINDFLTDTNTTQWHLAAQEAGIKSAGTFPIKFNGDVIGVLGVYSDTINYFQNKEIILLEEVALLISFGLEELHKETEKKLAEKKIKQLADIIEHSSTFVAISTPDGRDVYKNNAFKKALAIEGDDVTQYHFNDFHTALAKEILPDVFNTVMKNGIASFENELISKTGHIFPVLQTIMLHKNEQGEPEFFSTTAIDITEIKQKEAELEKRASELRSLSNHLVTVREEERRSIAKDIHDELGQNLTILKMDAHWISTHLDGNKQDLQDKLKQFKEITEDTVKTSRRLYNSLYPQMIEDIGLVGAIKWHANKYYDQKEIEIHFDTDLDEVKLFPENNIISLVLFRIYQECFTNIMRHANAKNINIYIKINDGVFSLIIKDDGNGFIVDQVDSTIHHGLIGMRERVLALSGKINIQSELGKGTITAVQIPC